MIAHTIVYVILSLLSVTAVYAANTPVQKTPQVQAKPGDEHKDDPKTL